jgi:uncharacterized membrane protein
MTALNKYYRSPQRLLTPDSDRRLYYWLTGALLLALAVRLYGMTTSAIWCDEGSSVLMSQFPLPQLWYHAGHDVHPPLYYILLRGWMLAFGESLTSIRLLSVLPGVGAVALGVWLMKTIATRRAALLAALLLALYPFAVRYSQEVRMYSLLSFWLIGATLALVYWLRQPQRKTYLLAYVLLMTAGFYTHYFTGLCVLAHWAYIGLRSTSRSTIYKPLWKPAWWLANVAIVLLYLPWIPRLVDQLQHLDQLKVGGDVGWIPAITPSSVPSALWQFWNVNDGLSLPDAAFLALPLLLVILAYIAVRSDRSAERYAGLLAIYSFVPLLVITLVSLAVPLLVERYLMFAAMGLPLLVALALDRVLEKRRALGLALLAILLAVEIDGIANNYQVEQPQFDTLVYTVNQQFKPGDRIVVSDMFWYLSYVYYNRTGAEPYLYTPPLADGTSGRPNAWGFGTLFEQQGASIYLDTLNALPDNGARVWLVSLNAPVDDFASIPQYWRLETSQPIGDTRLRLYSTAH